MSQQKLETLGNLSEQSSEAGTSHGEKAHINTY